MKKHNIFIEVVKENALFILIPLLGIIAFLIKTISIRGIR